MSLARDIGGRFISEINREFAETGMHWHGVSSSNVSSVGYNDMTNVLGIRFLNGSEYEYYSVPNEIFEGLRTASSPGKFVHGFIKGHYAYERVS